MNGSTPSLEAQLSDDEQLVWTGRGNSDRLLRRSDYVWVWIGLVLGVVAFMAAIAAVMTMFNGEPAGSLIGLLTALTLGGIGIYLVFGRFARRFARTRRAAYGITSTRVIAMRTSSEPGAAPEVVQVPITEDLVTALTTHYDGRGTITVGELELENIDDAAVVFELLQVQLARTARAQG